MSLRESSEWTRRNQLRHQQQQKETAKKAVNSSKTELKPLYHPLYSDSYIQKRQEQHIHDKFCWKVGFVIIAVLIGFFVWILIEIL